MIMISPTKGQMTVDEMVQDMKQYIAESTCPVEIVVGADSQNSSETKFVLVVAMYRKGQGGRFFYHTEKQQLIKNLRLKIYRETQLTLKMAEMLSEKMIENEVFHNVIVHIDIGTEGKTNKLINEIKGWVISEGYEIFIKPECYAAAAIANMLSK